MFWESLAAIFLLLTTIPLWVAVGVLWGLIKAALTFCVLILAMIGSPEISLDDLWAVLVGTVLQGLQAAWSVPTGIWDWAKYQHPWWAVAIGFLAMALSSGASRR